MRWKLLAVVAAVVGMLNLVVPLGTTPAAIAAEGIISDPAGDATDFVLPTGLPSEASEPSLDILAGDIAVTPETLTTTVVVQDLVAEAPRGGNGRLFRWYFSYAGMEFHTRAGQLVDGTTYFRLYDPAAVLVPCPGCTGSFDVTTDTITTNVPIVTLNAKIAALTAGATPPIGEGAELGGLEILSQRQVSAPAAGGVTPSADSASADRSYRVGPPPVPVGGVVNPLEKDDAVVIAVIDFNLVPYHWDFDAAHLPQHLDADPANDLPLDQAPDTWLPGFPSTSAFSSYAPLDLTMSGSNPNARMEDLAAADASTWASVPTSTATDVNYRWIPGSKVIGAVDFGGSTMRGTPGDHGVGVTSVSAGNLHGTCPECLLVFVNIATPERELPVPHIGLPDRSRIEAAINWATNQPWIDVVTNSYGINTVGGNVRDNVYGGTATVDGSRAASERGQTVFFSAGNGIENAFVVPNSTYFSSLKGPDWYMTVGAITPAPDDATFSGAGKPVDLSGIGSDYPSAYTATHVNGTGPTGFSGTSNATPTIAGIYARTLYRARAALAGPSRDQAAGVIATGAPFECGATRPACELGDGVLTATELRNRLLLGAVPSADGISAGGLASINDAGDSRFASEGHGAYRARQTGLAANWKAEEERLLAPLEGRDVESARPAGEREWMTVDSFCRQHLWGAWTGGYFRAGEGTLAAADYEAFPIRSAIADGCPALRPIPTP